MATETLMGDLGAGNFLPMLSGAGAGAMNVILVLVWVIFAAGVLWFVFYWSSFKHTVLIREITGSRRFIVRDKARIKLDKNDNVEYWYLRNRKVKLVSPKPESIEITRKGRFFAEVYHNLESGKDAGYSWATDDVNEEGIKFINYPAEHRALLSSRIRRAAERRGKSTFEMVMTIAAVSIPLIALIMVFSFWGDLTSQTVDASQSLQATMKDFSSKISDYSTCSQSIQTQNTPFIDGVPLDKQTGALS